MKADYPGVVQGGAGGGGYYGDGVSGGGYLRREEEVVSGGQGGGGPVDQSYQPSQPRPQVVNPVQIQENNNQQKIEFTIETSGDGQLISVRPGGGGQGGGQGGVPTVGGFNSGR